MNLRKYVFFLAGSESSRFEQVGMETCGEICTDSSTPPGVFLSDRLFTPHLAAGSDESPRRKTAARQG